MSKERGNKIGGQTLIPGQGREVLVSPSMRRDLVAHGIGVLEVLYTGLVIDARPCEYSMLRHSSDGETEGIQLFPSEVKMISKLTKQVKKALR